MPPPLTVSSVALAQVDVLAVIHIARDTVSGARGLSKSLAMLSSSVSDCTTRCDPSQVSQYIRGFAAPSALELIARGDTGIDTDLMMEHANFCADYYVTVSALCDRVFVLQRDVFDVLRTARDHPDSLVYRYMAGFPARVRDVCGYITRCIRATDGRVCTRVSPSPDSAVASCDINVASSDDERLGSIDPAALRTLRVVRALDELLEEAAFVYRATCSYDTGDECMTATDGQCVLPSGADCVEPVVGDGAYYARARVGGMRGVEGVRRIQPWRV